MSANKTTQGGQYFMIRSKNTKLVSKTPNNKTSSSPKKITPLKKSNAKESIFDENSNILKRIQLFHKSPKKQQDGVNKLIQILTHIGLNQKELFLKNLFEHCCLLIMEQKINEYNKQKLLGRAFKGLKESQSKNKAKLAQFKQIQQKKEYRTKQLCFYHIISIHQQIKETQYEKYQPIQQSDEYFVIAKHQRINTERSKIQNILNMKTKAPEHIVGTNTSSRERINSRKSENSVSSLQLDKPRKSTGKFKQDQPWNLSNSQIDKQRKSTGKFQKDEPQIQPNQTIQNQRKSTASNQSVSSLQIEKTGKSQGKLQKEEFQSSKKHKTKNSLDLDSQLHSSIAPQPFFNEPEPINMPWQSDLDEISFRGSDNSLQFTLAKNHQSRNLKQKLMNFLKVFYTNALVKEDAVIIARIDIQKRQVFFHWYSQIQNLRKQNLDLKNGSFNLKNILEFIIKKQVLNIIYEAPKYINQALPNSTKLEKKQNGHPQKEEQLNTIEESKLIEVKEEMRKSNIKDEKNDEKKKMNQKEANQKEELRNSYVKSDMKKTIKEDKKPREEKKLKDDKKIEMHNQEQKMHKEEFKVPVKRQPQQKKIEEEPKKKFVQDNDQNQFVWSKINKWLLDPNQKSMLEEN